MDYLPLPVCREGHTSVKLHVRPLRSREKRWVLVLYLRELAVISARRGSDEAHPLHQAVSGVVLSGTEPRKERLTID